MQTRHHQRLLMLQKGWPAAFVFLLACIMPAAVVSQQTSALAGQLLPPNISGDASTPVFLTVAMNKLLNVDTVNYRFEVIMEVLTSWRDPRAGEIYNNGLFVGLSDVVAATSRFQTCKYDATVVDSMGGNYTAGVFSETVADGIDAKCRASLANPLNDNCSRYCIPDVYPICCDAVWIPAIDIHEVVSYPQDRFVHDIIVPFSGNGFPNSSGVYRQTRVHAIFSSGMSFRKFPFDKHVLQVEFLGAGAYFHLVPSGLTRNRALILTLGASGSERADELARWKVTDLSLECTVPRGLNESSFDYRPLDPNDPVLELLRPASTASTQDTTPSDDPADISSCRLLIHIERLHKFYGWNLIFPMVVTVSMSFAVFFVDPTDIGVRLGTTTTLFLALTALQFVTSNELPTSSYLTAFHKLVIFSYFIIIFIVFQNLLVHFIASYEERHGRLKGAAAKRRSALILGSSCRANSAPDRSIANDADSDPRDAPPPPYVQVDQQKDAEGDDGEEGETREDRGQEAELSQRRSEDGMMSRILTIVKLGASPLGMTDIKGHVLEGKGYKKAHYLDGACVVLVPLTYWIGAIVIFT